MLGEVNQTEAYTSSDILYMCNLKRNGTNELTNSRRVTDLRELTCGCWGEGIVREFGMDIYTQLYFKWMTNKDLLYSTWNSALCYTAAWIAGEFAGRMNTCMYMAGSLCCSPETIWLYLNTKLKALKNNNNNKKKPPVKITVVLDYSKIYIQRQKN